MKILFVVIVFVLSSCTISQSKSGRLSAIIVKEHTNKEIKIDNSKILKGSDCVRMYGIFPSGFRITREEAIKNTIKDNDKLIGLANMKIERELYLFWPYISECFEVEGNPISYGRGE